MSRLATLAFVALSIPLQAFAQVPDYLPYGGMSGYREIDLGNDTFFVQFRGNQRNPPSEVDELWRTRAAELCRHIGAPQFIELKHVLEPVLRTDPQLLRERAEPKKVADRTIIIPIPVPVYAPSGGPASPNGPYKQAHVRCLRDASGVIDPARIIKVAEVIESAKAKGWIAPGSR